MPGVSNRTKSNQNSIEANRTLIVRLSSVIEQNRTSIVLKFSGSERIRYYGTNYFHLYCTWAKSKTSPYKGLTHIRPLSRGFDSSVGRALHRHHRDRGFESRSEIFSGLFSSSVTAAPALMTIYCAVNKSEHNRTQSDLVHV